MKHEKGSNQEINNFILQNQSFENYFSEYAAQKDIHTLFSASNREVPFVVEWQMKNDKKENSIKFK
jgi:hypothetical protein